MDRLSEEQRAAIIKNSDSRLRAKLVQAGFQAKDLEGLERSKLVEMMAAVIAEENTRTMEAEAVIGAGMDPEEMEDADVGEERKIIQKSVEERLVILREMEMEERRQARLLEKDKLEQEKKRFEQERIFKERELQLKEEEMKFEREKAKREKEWKESPPK